MLGTIGALRLAATSVLRQAGWYTKVPEPFLVPTGIVLMIAGLLFILASVSSWSQNRLVAMTRREFSAFFVSPVAYIVMIAFSVIGVGAYANFLLGILGRAREGQPLEEPIVAEYLIAFFPVFAVMVAVPLLTMRLFSEEKRTGSLEVLLTAPVTDWEVVLSKFFAALLMFMLLWAPWALNLLALRLEAGKPFDFRPLLGFALALFASGSSFVAMGLFFSCVTNNQIVSAALSFMGMMVLIALYFLIRLLTPNFVSFLNMGEKTVEVVKEVMRTMSFIDMWIQATEGKIWLKYVVFHISAAVMWLLMSVKVLESRRWS
jgi:ABC-2 type transport system permease protein